VDGAGALADDRAGLVHGLADDVHDAAQGAGADGHRDRRAGVMDFLAADQALGGVHGDAADGALAELLRHFEHQAVAAVGGFERVQDLRQVAFELHVDDGADDLRDVADLGVDGSGVGHVRLLSDACQSASAPEMISISSLVIIA
jgi:hypothetical protein